MTKRSYLIILLSSLFLLIGAFALTVFHTFSASAFSLIHENKNSNISSNNYSNNLKTTNNTNSTLLKQLGLYTIYKSLNNTIINLMSVAETSKTGLNSFGVLPQVNVTDEMKIKYHGIPSDQDMGKRNEAKKLLANNKALLYVGLLLPNGDRYFGEPYFPYQTNSSTTNFAYRDHFNGAIKTQHPYLSNVINAVSTGKPLAILATPIYSDTKNHNSLIGIQVLGLNFTYFNDLIKSIISTENNNIKRVVIVDSNGTKIADSFLDKNNNTESFKKLQSFQNAKMGESGLLTEDVSGKNMSISYTPIKFAQTNWIILLLSSN